MTVGVSTPLAEKLGSGVIHLEFGFVCFARFAVAGHWWDSGRDSGWALGFMAAYVRI